MAEGKSFVYCDSDEEVFIGKVTDKEWTKGAAFGQNYYSPIVKSTPRSKVLNKSTKQPDVLTESTCTISTSRISANTEEDDIDEQSKCCQSANSSVDENDSVVILDDINDFVQIISDDESFLLHEKLVEENDCGLDLDKDNTYLKEGMNNLSLSSIKENVNVDYSKRGNSFNSATSEVIDFEKNAILGTKSVITANTSNDDCMLTCSSFSDEDTAQFQDCTVSSQDIVALEDTNKNASIVSNQDVALEDTNKTTSVILIQDVEALKDNKKTTSIGSSQDINVMEDINKTTSIRPSQDIGVLQDIKNISSIISIQDVEALKDTNKTTSIESGQDIDVIENINKTTSIRPSQDVGVLQDIKNTSSIISIQDVEALKDTKKTASIGSIQDIDVMEDINKTTSINSPLQRDSHKNVSVKLDMKSTAVLEEKHIYSKKLSAITNNSACDSEYTSLNGISDSVLDISHGSSLSSPLNPKSDNATKNLQLNVYEDISCDGEPQFDSTNRSSCALPESVIQNDDLHMSVDEHDYQHSLQIVNPPGSENTSQPSLYNSCFDRPSSSSYHTAFNTISSNPTPEPSVGPFNSYRETLSDTGDHEESDVAEGLDIDNAIKNETSFEIIVQKRQNSFTPSSPPAVKKANNTEQVKSKGISKLPVYNHSSKSLIKPPKLNITSQSLKLTNDKWAKNLTKPNSDKIDSSKGRISSVKHTKSKIASPFPKVNVLPNFQQNNEKLPNEMICTKISNKLKSPLINKTPAKTATFQAVGKVKSESKTPSITSSNIKNTLSNDKIKSKIQSSYSQDKDRYKNVISPIRLYISGNPPVLQEKKTVAFEETKLVVSSGNKNTNSHLPIRMATPLTSTRVVQKLKYDKNSPGLMPQQENVDPNYSRDTLPPRALQSSAAVFMKEPEQPQKYLPKMGGNTQRLLDTPRPKVVLHQGRVNNSPNIKGILFPSFDMKSPEHNEEVSAARVSIRVVKAAERSNELK